MSADSRTDQGARTPSVLYVSNERANVLDTLLTAEPAGDAVELQLTVTNEGDDAVTLSFSDAQRAEFVASDDEEVWRWSDDRMFAMVTGRETLDPGEDVTFEATWSNPSPGEYEVRAWVTAADVDATAETDVTVT